MIDRGRCQVQEQTKDSIVVHLTTASSSKSKEGEFSKKSARVSLFKASKTFKMGCLDIHTVLGFKVNGRVA